MNRLKLIQWIIVSLSVVMLSACGGGSSGDSTPATGSNAQEEAIEIISNYEVNGVNTPTVQDYTDAGVTGVNEGNIDNINEALLEEGTGDTQEEIQAIADYNGHVYENGENGDIAGWSTYDQGTIVGTISNVEDKSKDAYDDKGNRVIQLSGDKTDSGYLFGTEWDNSREKIIKWSMKYSEWFYIYVKVQTLQGERHFEYIAKNTDDGISDDKIYIVFGIGSDAADGTWKTFERNLEEDLKVYEEDNEIVSVDNFLIRGSGMIDDIEFVKSE